MAQSIRTPSPLRTGMNPEGNKHATVSDYREFPVPALLANHFLCFWTQRIVGSGEYAHSVLPDCCIEIVFINDELPIVVGPWTDSFIAKFSGGARITGVRLRPGYAPSVLGVPASELLNRSIPLPILWGRRRTEPFARIREERHLTARRLALSEVLSSSFASAAPPDETVIMGMRWLARHPHGRVWQLGRLTGLRERQIQRLFCAAVGYGPKTFHSVLRFQRLLYLKDAKYGRRSLAELAASAGYADQPHMTREVRRFGGCPPSALLSSAQCTLRMSGLFETYVESPEYLQALRLKASFSQH